MTSPFNSPVRNYTLALQILALTAIYYLTGKLGTSLAIPPGYATAIWPPSGIALAGILVFGYRVWPGILLGSFLVNLSTSLGAGSPSETLISVIVTLTIGGGAALQAVVAAYLLRRFANFPNPLTSETDVFLFLLVGGVLGSLVNSTLSVSTLVVSGQIPPTNFLANWGTWWFGDALGIFIFTPLALVWSLGPSESWRKRRIAITLPIIAMFVITTAVVFYESKKETERLSFEFNQRALEMKAALEISIANHITALHALESFHSATTTFDRASFKNFVSYSLANLSGIQALSWNPSILSSERDAFERSVKSEGYRDFQIIEQDSHKQRIRAGNRPEYVPVDFIEPYQGNEKALGYDVYSDQFRRKTIDQARDTGEIATTAARINLVQDQKNQYGILTFLPIYRKGLSHATLEERRHAILGYWVAVSRGEDFATAALKEANRERLSYRLIDERAPANEQLIFSSDGENLKPLTLQEKGLFGRNLSLLSQFAISTGGRAWRFEVIPTQEYVIAHQTDNAWLVLLAGLMLTSMAGAFAMVSSGRGSLLLKLVEERTAEMAKSLSLLYATLDSTNDAILAVDLNNTWVLHNQQFIDLWHITDDIIATKDDNAALSYILNQVYDPDAFLLRVRELYASPELSSFETIRLKNGKIIERYSIPQRIDAKVVGRVWSFRDVTERVLAEQSLQRESEKNRALLRNASDGIHILDLNGNLIEASDSFCAMLGYSREEVIGMNVVQWDAQHLRSECIQLVKQQFAKPERALFETRHRRKDKSIFDVEVSGFPLELEGKPVLFNSSRDISARKETEVSLKKLLLAVEQSPNSVMITNLDGSIEYVNETFVKVTGYSRAEIIGQNPRLLQSGKTVKATYQEIWATLTNGEVWKGELINKKKNGIEYIESTLISPVRQTDGKITHYVGIKEDITERKQAEWQLQESEKRFRIVADAAPVFIWLSGTDKLCTWVNQVWLDFTGRSIEQELGTGWADSVHPDDLERCLGIYASHFDRREPFSMEYRLKHHDGEYRWIQGNGVPRFDANAIFDGYIGSCMDVTDQVIAREETRKAKDAAEALAQSKSNFLANMSHEIRTPMNAIIGLSYLALNKELSPEIRDYLEKINHSSSSLLDILNDVLDFSKIEAGHLTIDKRNFNLDAMLDNIRNMLADSAKKKQLGFKITIATDVPRDLVGDTHRLQQVLINLLGNAIKFTDKGHVTLDITLQQRKDSEVNVLFRVIDTGIGMSARDREKLFQPFSQADDSISRRFGGTGLGLAISHNLLQLMNSGFSVDSSPGKGSVFSFELVFGLPSSSSRSQSSLMPIEGHSGKSLARTRILVAEDNQTNQQVVREFLNLNGIHVEIANNGKEALVLLENCLFDAVLMDIHMPEMDGFETTKLIRNQAQFNQLPVIALTAGVTQEEQKRCFASGMNDFIAKPINPQELLSKLALWIKPTSTGIIESAQEDIPDMHKLPGFDLSNLLVMLGNNQALAKELLLSFMDNMAPLSAEIEAMMTREDFSSAQELVHKIKGAAGNVGAIHLFAAAETLEEQLNGEFSVATLNTFLETFKQTMQVISKLHQAEDLIAHGSGNSEAANRIAEELNTLLQENDFISESLLNALKPHLATDQLELFAQLKECVNDLQYNDAHRILQQLIAVLSQSLSA